MIIINVVFAYCTRDCEHMVCSVQWTFNDIHNNHSKYTWSKQKNHTIHILIEVIIESTNKYNHSNLLLRIQKYQNNHHNKANTYRVTIQIHRNSINLRSTSDRDAY